MKRRSAFRLPAGLALLTLLAPPSLVGPGVPSAAAETYVIAEIGTLGGSESQAAAINPDAQVTGYARTATGARHAFRWEQGKMADLGTLPGAANSAGAAINVAGDVVGAPRAFVMNNGVMTDLNSLLPAGSGWVLQAAHGIDGYGHIVGTGVVNGQARGFFLTPAPADLAIAQTASPDPVLAGSNVTYTLTAANKGPNPALHVTVSDTLPTGTTFVSCSSTGGVCGGSGNRRTVTLLEPGACLFLHFAFGLGCYGRGPDSPLCWDSEGS